MLDKSLEPVRYVAVKARARGEPFRSRGPDALPGALLTYYPDTTHPKSGTGKVFPRSFTPEPGSGHVPGQQTKPAGQTDDKPSPRDRGYR